MTTTSKATAKTAAIIAGTVIAVFAAAIIAVIVITNRIAPATEATPTPENLNQVTAGEPAPVPEPEPEPLPTLDNDDAAMRHGLSNISRCTGGIQTYSYGTMQENTMMGIITTDPLGGHRIVANFKSENGQVTSIHDPASLSTVAEAEMTTGDGRSEQVLGNTKDTFFTLGLTPRQAEKFGRLENITLTQDGERIGACTIGE